jgi:hypothetical protein
MRSINLRIDNPRLSKLINFCQLDLAQLIVIANHYCFPVDLIGCMDDFLETELLKILVNHRAEPVALSIRSTNCDSTDELKVLVRQKVQGQIYLADGFMSEYFDRVSQEMNDKQFNFYEQLFKKISNDKPAT